MLGFTDLPRPRSLTAAERDLLSALVARSGSAGLAAQLETAAVTGICTCGCPSVRLTTDGPAITPAAVAALSSAGEGVAVALPSPQALRY